MVDSFKKIKIIVLVLLFYRGKNKLARIVSCIYNIILSNSDAVGCVVDIGKGKLEMCIDNQKIKFDLFDAKKHLLDRNVCLEVEELKNEMVLMARAKLTPDT